MTRTHRAWELNNITVRIVRFMLADNDVASLLETGTGTPEEGELMVRCYELAAMEMWDDQALLEAATVDGINAGFTRAGEDPERIRRKIAIAMSSNSAPAYMPPPAGIKLLYRLGVMVFDELEETVSRFEAIGRYEPSDFEQAALNTESAAPEPSISAPLGETAQQRRARWLALYGAGERGAVQRVYESELLLNPRADRSFIGKEIEKAKQEKAEAAQDGFFSQLGKRP